MAFTIRLCPYCGGDISSDDTSYYVCEECGKRTYRSRSNSKAFLANKPYEKEYTDILNLVKTDADKALSSIDEIISGAEKPDADMYFTRGVVYSALGEEGKAHNDWKKGLDALTDLRFIDAYVIPVCRSITELVCMKEREFIEFNPVEYTDIISTEFSEKAEVPFRGVFYITIYRNMRIKLQSGALDDDEDIYPTIIPKLLNRILAYGRDFRTQCTIIEEVLDDFKYNPDTYEEDDNLLLHMCEILMHKYRSLSENFSDEHITRIFRHWNDENMFELEYWVDDLMKGVRDENFLQKLRNLASPDKEDYNLEEAVEDYARRYLLLSKSGEDLSKES